MPILAAEAIDVHFGARRIFEDDSLAIEPRERLGIVGVNGAGKSTLMRILAGQVAPDGGTVTRAAGCRIGYLAQEHGDVGDGSLLEQVLKAAPGRDALTARVAAVEQSLLETADPEVQLALSGELADLVADLADLEHEFGAHRAKKILAGLGFSETDFDRPLTEFSGGWRMRGALAALLYERPDVLLLDEPTNHLDMPSVQWLDGFLRTFPKALVITCHDREFLNRQIRRVASVEPEGLRVYAGNYDDYVAQRALELEYLEARARKDDQRKKELEAFVTRFKAKASKARQAQSKAKLIEKMKDDVVELPKVRRTMSIRFQPTERPGDPVVRLEDVSFGYADVPLFSALNLSIRRGERVAIVGVNGAGKTTLLRIIAKELSTTAGNITYGRNVAPSYFAQHHTLALAPHRTVLEEVWQANTDLSPTAARNICGSFLFSADDVDKRIEILSGGEKARVALAKLLAAPGNFLLLDEPTNHLDTDSADRLTEALESYDGTLLFISHSLHFARRLANTVWNVEAGTVTTYPGTLNDYLDHLEAKREAMNEARSGANTPDFQRTEAHSEARTEKALRIEAREEEKKRRAEERKNRVSLEKRIGALEQEIDDLERSRSELEVQMTDPSIHADADRMRDVVQRYAQTKSRLEDSMEAWEKLQATLEEGS
ncbi:MAG: ABC-F family ATP-binding cassette domain-containing protein [Deltaproteobacteria bacterium]|nr:ABC-F family ATP-binding cassette domain-containing protein [Deltaproteobacteria bacterium]